jgi:hypothetical protein
MKKTFIYSIILLLSMVCVSIAFGWDYNKDIQNKGPNAHDVTVRIPGHQVINWHWDDYGHFGSFAYGPTGPNTDLRWNNFWDGTDDEINTNQWVHIGWTSDAHEMGILDMWWTDESGHRIPGSVVYNDFTKWTYETSTHTVTLTWDNDFVPDPAFGSPQTISVSNVHFAILPAPIALADLNGENDSLAAHLQPLPNGCCLSIPPNQSVTMSIPVPVAEGAQVVIRYEVTAPGTSGESIDYLGFRPTSVVPTVSEWGLIILALLFISTAVWVLMRRRARLSI